MRKKVSGYALTNKDGKYLVFNQVSDNDIEIYASDNVDDAMLFEEHFQAHVEGYNVKFNMGDWNYILSKDAIPTNIVKVKKCIEIDSIGEISEIVFQKPIDKHKK